VSWYARVVVPIAIVLSCVSSSDTTADYAHTSSPHTSRTHRQQYLVQGIC
jgi:hypothetical protein